MFLSIFVYIISISILYFHILEIKQKENTFFCMFNKEIYLFCKHLSKILKKTFTHLK